MNPNIIAATIIAIGMVIHAYGPKPITLAIANGGYVFGMSYPISNTHSACGPGGCYRWELNSDGDEATIRKLKVIEELED